MANDFSRRKFISTSAAALSGTVLMNSFPLIGHAMKTDTIRVGLIGAGTRGAGIAHLLKDLPGLAITAVCDIMEDNLQKGMSLAVKEAKSYTDHKKLLENKDIDAVIIATPLYLHHPMAMDALDAGKHVYVEKTMTYDIPQTLSLVKKVKNSRLVLQVGHQYRYYALYHRIKEVLSQNWAGKVTQIECQYHRNSNWRFPVKDPRLERQVNWRMYKQYSGGLMAELCGHQIDIVNWMLDSHPLKVTGFGGIDYWKDGRETYDNVRTVFVYPDGVKASVSSILTNAFKGYSIRILGTKATIEIQRDKAFIYAEAQDKELGTVDGVTGATVKAWTQGEPVPIEFMYPDAQKRDPTSYALLDFAACIRTGKKPASNVETGRDAAIAVHIANKAMATEQCVKWIS